MPKASLIILLCLSLLLPGCALPAAVVPNPTVRPTKTVSTPTVAMPTATPLPRPTLIPTETLRLPTPTLFPPVTVQALPVHSNFLGVDRMITMYLPGDYNQRPDRRYRVLYVFDAQELPLIAFEQHLNSLVMNLQIDPILVVAVPSAEGDMRREELGAGPYINVFGWGKLSDAFNKFMVYELVPAVDKAYRTQRGPQNTAIMGWSLGGLAAFYLAWQYPDVFGIVGAFSPSFWWRTASDPGFELQARVVHKVVRESARRPGLRMWFEAGTGEVPSTDIDQNGVADVIQDIQDLMTLLEQKGYQRDSDMIYQQVEGGKHELATWGAVLPNFLNWAFGKSS